MIDHNINLQEIISEAVEERRKMIAHLDRIQELESEIRELQKELGELNDSLRPWQVPSWQSRLTNQIDQIVDAELETDNL